MMPSSLVVASGNLAGWAVARHTLVSFRQSTASAALIPTAKQTKER